MRRAIFTCVQSHVVSKTVPSNVSNNSLPDRTYQYQSSGSVSMPSTYTSLPDMNLVSTNTRLLDMLPTNTSIPDLLVPTNTSIPDLFHVSCYNLRIPGAVWSQLGVKIGADIVRWAVMAARPA